VITEAADSVAPPEGQNENEFLSSFVASVSSKARDGSIRYQWGQWHIFGEWYCFVKLTVPSFDTMFISWTLHYINYRK